ncbi:MAG TPA: glycogen synthase GlgA [Kiritimatiellia bacterium]|nr:glycogen synthase GlgA [Kiritimatiellia bacterium]HMP34293.1 glycogen synthase GlgA [Kiritimatiellia bacterium]
MNIAFVSSEITPYASTGGLADVCGSLPRALVDLGCSVTQFMPMYRRVIEGAFGIEDTGIRLTIPVGFHRYRADVWKTKNAVPPVYFIRRDEFFDRTELYNLSDRDYDDNFERFVFFQKAVTALIDHLKRPFDVVHAHDWQTGLLPLYLRHGLQGEGRGGREKTVFTIHNLAFQGIFNGDEFSYSNLPFSSFSVETLEYYGNVNCLKSGITTSDLVTTVSRTYAREIQTEENGHGLHGVLANAAPRLRGIVNGIDHEVWDPTRDKALAARYGIHDLSGKQDCKSDLIRRLKISLAPDEPLFGMVTRLTNQKGVELVDDVLPWIMEQTKGALVLLGSGSEAYQEMVTRWGKRWPGRVVVRFGFDAKLAHRIEAAADIYLMPSKFEPCGLNQLYSLRYGTIPIVHAVGGLEDTVVDLTESPHGGYGFKFKDFSSAALQGSVQRALAAYKKPSMWKSIQLQAMKQDFSWRNSARQYLASYGEVLGIKPAAKM